MKTIVYYDFLCSIISPKNKKSRATQFLFGGVGGPEGLILVVIGYVEQLSQLGSLFSVTISST